MATLFPLDDKEVIKNICLDPNISSWKKVIMVTEKIFTGESGDVPPSFVSTLKTLRVILESDGVFSKPKHNIYSLPKNTNEITYLSVLFSGLDISRYNKIFSITEENQGVLYSTNGNTGLVPGPSKIGSLSLDPMKPDERLMFDICQVMCFFQMFTNSSSSEFSPTQKGKDVISSIKIKLLKAEKTTPPDHRYIFAISLTIVIAIFSLAVLIWSIIYGNNVTSIISTAVIIICILSIFGAYHKDPNYFPRAVEKVTALVKQVFSSIPKPG